jgi:hypothetical protein
VALLELADAQLGEAQHGLRTRGLGEEAQRLRRQVRVAVRQRGLTVRRHDVPAGGPTSTLGDGARSGLVDGDLVAVLQDAQVPADARRREVELGRELGRRHGTRGGDELQHPLAGSVVGGVRVLDGQRRAHDTSSGRSGALGGVR